MVHVINVPLPPGGTRTYSHKSVDVWIISGRCPTSLPPLDLSTEQPTSLRCGGKVARRDRGEPSTEETDPVMSLPGAWQLNLIEPFHAKCRWHDHNPWEARPECARSFPSIARRRRRLRIGRVDFRPRRSPCPNLTTAPDVGGNTGTPGRGVKRVIMMEHQFSSVQPSQTPL